eukprot:TRINITY_DN3290_c0_g1_i1.p1 TRINITY_DN3290_c0_g1~~TRINITY_DN3290_c0_g1_i1.p1  ORF type:complete len:670 (+),score=80.35 TRINITY_DN3290_c0_g1_i1:65-2074(+)
MAENAATPPGLVVHSQEQAAALAAKILKESGMERDIANPASAKLLAHQVLAGHVIESQKAEVERLRAEVARLEGVLQTKNGALGTPGAVNPPSQAIASPSFAPSSAGSAAGTVHSPAQAAYHSRAVRAMHSHSVISPPGAAVVDEGPGASAQVSAAPWDETTAPHSTPCAVMAQPASTVQLQQAVFSGAAPRDSDAEFNMTMTTAPPPFETPSSNAPSNDSDLDWNNVTKDVMAVLHNLTKQREAAEYERGVLQERLLQCAQSPRMVEEAVFDSPLRNPGATHDGSVFALEAAPPPVIAAPPLPVDAATTILDATQASTTSPTPQAPDLEPSASQARTASRVSSARRAGGVPSTAQQLAAEHQSPTQELCVDRRSSASHHSGVVGTFASPDGVAQPPRSEDGALPHGWREFKTQAGRAYYYNTVTQKSHWRRPTQPAGKPLTINININVDKKKGVGPAPGASQLGEEAQAHIETIVRSQDGPQDTAGESLGGPRASEAPVPPPMMGVAGSVSSVHGDQALFPSGSTMDASVARVASEATSPACLTDAAPAASHVSSQRLAPQLSVSREPTQQSSVAQLAARSSAGDARGVVAAEHLHSGDPRSGSPAIYPPVNSKTTVVVEELDSGLPRIHVKSDAPVRCVACGTTLNHGASYCHNCGWRAMPPDVLSR